MTDDTSPGSLRKFLESDDSGLRSMGLSMAKGSGVPEELYKNVLGLSLWDPEEENRKIAAALVKKIGLKNISEFPEWLEPFEENEIHGNLRPSAARALGEIGDVRAVEPLIKALAEGNPSASEALDKFGNKRTIDSVIGMLQDKNEHVRMSAMRALEEIGEHMIEPLIKALENKKEQIPAAELLDKLGIVTDEFLATKAESDLNSCPCCSGDLTDGWCMECGT